MYYRIYLIILLIFSYITGVLGFLSGKKYEKDNHHVDNIGSYPSCDMVNNAIRYILKDGDTDKAVSELVFAIQKADGYLHEDIKELLNNNKQSEL